MVCPPIFHGQSLTVKKKNSSGWWYTYPSEQYAKVSWGYYSQYMGK